MRRALPVAIFLLPALAHADASMPAPRKGQPGDGDWRVACAARLAQAKRTAALHDPSFRHGAVRLLPDGVELVIRALGQTPAPRFSLLVTMTRAPAWRFGPAESPDLVRHAYASFTTPVIECLGGDTDGDRIPDPVDKCPTHPEVYDGVADDDGCPD